MDTKHKKLTIIAQYITLRDYNQLLVKSIIYSENMREHDDYEFGYKLQNEKKEIKQYLLLFGIGNSDRLLLIILCNMVQDHRHRRQPSLYASL